MEDKQESNSQKESINVIVNVPEQDNTMGVVANRIASKSNRIALYSIVVNTILAAFTYLLWKEAIEATKTASNSLSETKKAVNEAVSSNNIAEKNYNLSKSAFDSSIASGKVASENVKQSFNLQSKSVEAQIQSLKETQKQFIAANEPYLQYGEIERPIIEIGKQITIKYKIENIGKYPVKVIYTKGGVSFNVIAPNFNGVHKFSKAYNSFYNLYVINGSPLKYHMTPRRNIDEATAKALKDGKLFIYLVGFIRYQNLITLEKKQYNYQIRLRFNPEGIDYIINDNFTIE